MSPYVHDGYNIILDHDVCIAFLFSDHNVCSGYKLCKAGRSMLLEIIQAEKINNRRYVGIMYLLFESFV